MHEFGLCEDVVAAVERRAAGREVVAFTVRIGAMHRVSTDAFDSAFEQVRAGTVAAGAAPEVIVVPATMRCNDCGARSETLDPLHVCASCGSPDIALTGGDELVLESVTLAGTD